MDLSNLYFGKEGRVCQQIIIVNIRKKEKQDHIK